MTATVTTYRRVVGAELSEVWVEVDVPVVGAISDGDGIVLELVDPLGACVRVLARVRAIHRPTVNLDPSGRLRLSLEEIVTDRAVAR